MIFRQMLTLKAGGGDFMPRGKELEQLPMSNIAPSIGDDQSKTNRTSLEGMYLEEEHKTNIKMKK